MLISFTSMLCAVFFILCSACRISQATAAPAATALRHNSKNKQHQRNFLPANTAPTAFLGQFSSEANSVVLQLEEEYDCAGAGEIHLAERIDRLLTVVSGERKRSKTLCEKQNSTLLSNYESAKTTATQTQKQMIASAHKSYVFDLNSTMAEFNKKTNKLKELVRKSKENRDKVIITMKMHDKELQAATKSKRAAEKHVQTERQSIEETYASEISSSTLTLARSLKVLKQVYNESTTQIKKEYQTQVAACSLKQKERKLDIAHDAQALKEIKILLKSLSICEKKSSLLETNSQSNEQSNEQLHTFCSKTHAKLMENVNNHGAAQDIRNAFKKAGVGASSSELLLQLETTVVESTSGAPKSSFDNKLQVISGGTNTWDGRLSKEMQLVQEEQEMCLVEAGNNYALKYNSTEKILHEGTASAKAKFSALQKLAKRILDTASKDLKNIESSAVKRFKFALGNYTKSESEMKKAVENHGKLEVDTERQQQKEKKSLASLIKVIHDTHERDTVQARANGKKLLTLSKKTFENSVNTLKNKCHTDDQILQTKINTLIKLKLKIEGLRTVRTSAVGKHEENKESLNAIASRNRFMSRKIKRVKKQENIKCMKEVRKRSLQKSYSPSTRWVAAAMSRGYACIGRTLKDVPMKGKRFECMERCLSTKYCACVTYIDGRTCRMETGHRITNRRNNRYSGITMKKYLNSRYNALKKAQSQRYCKNNNRNFGCKNNAVCYDGVWSTSVIPTRRWGSLKRRMRVNPPVCMSKKNHCTGACSNGGKCINGLKTFSCVCPPQWTGKRCKKYNYCVNADASNNFDFEASRCKNNGVCTNNDLQKSFNCKCKKGFTGPLCGQTDFCSNKPCANKGKCLLNREKNGFTCQCSVYWMGETCKVNKQQDAAQKQAKALTQLQKTEKKLIEAHNNMEIGRKNANAKRAVVIKELKTLNNLKQEQASVLEALNSSSNKTRTSPETAATTKQEQAKKQTLKTSFAQLQFVTHTAELVYRNKKLAEQIIQVQEKVKLAEEEATIAERDFTHLRQRHAEIKRQDDDARKQVRHANLRVREVKDIIKNVLGGSNAAIKGLTDIGVATISKRGIIAAGIDNIKNTKDTIKNNFDMIKNFVLRTGPKSSIKVNRLETLKNYLNPKTRPGLAKLLNGAGNSLRQMKDHQSFCWKDSYTRGAGTVPPKCPEGYDRIGLLCYPSCKKGMARYGLDCHSKCPHGWENQGLFCRKNEYGRGVGTPINTCPKHAPVQQAALCYKRCPRGYDDAPFGRCIQKCPSGLDDQGLYCRKREYGRGAGFGWRWGDSLDGRSQYNRCKRSTQGRRYGCEWGVTIVYPKCKPGYHPVGCCLCRPNKFSCTRDYKMNHGIDISCRKKEFSRTPHTLQCPHHKEGCAGLCYKPCKRGYPFKAGCNICRPPVPKCSDYGLNQGLDLSCGKKIEVGGFKAITGICEDDTWEENGGLCYKKCRPGFHGVGPVCWGNRPGKEGDPDRWVNCGFGYAKDDKTCGIVTAEQVAAVGEVGMFIGTLGTASGGTAAAKGVKAAAKGAKAAGKFKKAAKAAGKSANVVKKLRTGSKMATKIDKIKDTAKVAVKVVDKASDAVDKVSGVIHAADGMKQAKTAEDIVRNAASMAALVDPTGVSSCVAAYTYPKCSKYFLQKRI